MVRCPLGVYRNGMFVFFLPFHSPGWTVFDAILSMRLEMKKGSGIAKFSPEDVETQAGQPPPWIISAAGNWINSLHSLCRQIMI